MTGEQRHTHFNAMRRRAGKYELHIFLNMLSGLYPTGMSQIQRRLWTRIWQRKRKEEQISVC